jgi:hypothetical protein
MRRAALAVVLPSALIAGCGSSSPVSTSAHKPIVAVVITAERKSRCDHASQLLLSWREAISRVALTPEDSHAIRIAVQLAKAAEQAAYDVRLAAPGVSEIDAAVNGVEAMTTHSRAGLHDLAHLHQPGIDAEVVGRSRLSEAESEYDRRIRTFDRACGLS